MRLHAIGIEDRLIFLFTAYGVWKQLHRFAAIHAARAGIPFYRIQIKLFAVTNTGGKIEIVF